MLLKRHVSLTLVALAAITCAALYLAHVRSQRITPAFATIAAESSPQFTEGSGWYPGEPFAHAAPQLRAWGSWTGDDANTGTVTLGPFPAPRILRFGIGGYPSNPGNTLHVERTDTHEKLLIDPGAIGERWRICDFLLPPAWEGRPVRLLGVDNSKTLGGWFALTEPLRGGRGEGNNALLETFTAWSINGLLLALLFFAAARVLTNSKLCVPPHWIPLGAGALVALCGYLVYWAYFAAPWLGWVITTTLYLAAGLSFLRSVPPSPSLQLPATDLRTVTTLFFTIGAFHLAILHLFPTPHDFYTVAANRYRIDLPGDNMLSHMYAERLFAGQPPKNPADEWQSSDRPPLQIGWQLLTWPVAKFLQLDRKTFSGTSAVWFQLLWIAGLYGLFRHFALSPRRTAAWLVVLGLTGFFLQNTAFTWPKLSAGAFATAAFALLFLPSQNSNFKSQIPFAAALAALAWLCHGSVAFSFLPLVPVVAWRLWRTVRPSTPRSPTSSLRPWLVAAALFAALVSPWIAYQKFYDPPANRLFKWHFAGQTQRDSRGFLETVRDSYAKLGWRAALDAKISNLHGQVFGDWKHLRDASAATKADRLNQEFFHTGRALIWWPLAAAFAVVLASLSARNPATRLKASPTPPESGPTALAPPLVTPDLLRLALWLVATILIWCLLMFGAYTASIHQGSYAVMFGLFAFFTVLLERAHPAWLLVVAALQLFTFATTWATPTAAIAGPPTALPIVVLSALPLVYILARGFTGSDGSPTRADFQPSSPLQSLASPSRSRSLVPGPWSLVLHHPWSLVLASAVALALRKPHALHTPQLWAEDGSIFLVQNDLHGLAALALPYMGYLHTLPRLIAFVTSHIADPAWWPHFYNGAAFLIWLAVIARLFTARFAHLPGRPWLALAMIAVPHTGEVFFNITNLQWLTAFVLIQQTLIAPPQTRTQRISDILILIVVALTGPFAVAFLPLFVVRWLLDLRAASNSSPSRSSAPGPWSLVLRHWPLVIPFAIVLVCAALQAWFVVRTGPRFDFQSAPFQLWPNLVILARRVLAFPLVGRDLALELPHALLGTVGTLFFAALALWSLRRDPQRPLRLQLLLAFALITLAGIYRTRPDTWAADNLDFGDRYFYIPRVLLAWLLILEFHSTPRLIAAVARIACVAALLIHIDDYTLRAPKDYNWAAHVAPIRRGEPASIPTLPEGWTLEYEGRRK